MAYIITEPCIGTKDSACVDVCPVDCIHPRKDEGDFEAATMLFIHPDECIDCGACVPAIQFCASCIWRTSCRGSFVIRKLVKIYWLRSTICSWV